MGRKWELEWIKRRTLLHTLTPEQRRNKINRRSRSPKQCRKTIPVLAALQ